MATIKFFLYSKVKAKLAPVHVRLSIARGKVFFANSGVDVDPEYWNKNWNIKTQKLKLQIKSDDDDKLEKDLRNIRDHIEAEVKANHCEHTKQWFQSVIDKFYNIKPAGATTFNGYIDLFIKESESHDRKNKDGLNMAGGTVRAWKVFKRNFNEFQGVYTDKRLKWLKENDKTPRPKKLIDFDGINIDSYNAFVRFMTDEGFKPSTIGRHIKELKMFMKKSMEEGLHNNRQFENSAFKMLKSEAYSIYLTTDEIEKIYKLDLKANPELDGIRDAFLSLCESGLRVSDYKKIPENIRTDANGTKLIYITQQKTGNRIVIPLSARLEAIIKKHDGTLPHTYDQLINKDIKIIAKMAGINEVQTWESEKFGKKFQKKAAKWELVSCHSGRRSFCTNAYLAGIPSIAIMQISGHKTEAMFMKYIKVTPEQNAIKLASHPYFSNLKVV